MMKFKYALILLSVAVLSVATTSCRQEATEVYDPTQEQIVSMSSQFQVMWNMIDRGYVFWEYDKTDWDAVYTKYYPKFKELDSRKEIPTKELSALYNEACAGLLDHHMHIKVTNLMAPKDETGDKKVVHIHPGHDEVTKRDYYCSIEDTTFTQMYAALEAQGRLTRVIDGRFKADGLNVRIVSGVVDGNVGYLYFNTFELANLAKGNATAVDDASKKPETAMAALKQYWEQLNDNSLKGMIIDIRNNGGGSTEDLYYVLSPMIDQKLTFGYVRHKQGLGRLDYSEWSPWSLMPNTTIPARIGMPLAVLINIWSVSMGEVTPTAARYMPNSVIVGQRSYGATGPLTSDFQSTYGTPAVSKDGSVNAYTSTFCFINRDGELIEGVGVDPDVWVDYDAKQFVLGNDAVLDKAVEFIQSK